MCRNEEGIYTGLPKHPAVMLINSNRAEANIRRIIQESRKKCGMMGITLMQECIVSKGPDRDIDRDAVNILIGLLMTGRYDTVAVERLADITEDSADLEEFMHDTASIGVGFFEISTMRYYRYEKAGGIYAVDRMMREVRAEYED